MEKRKGSEKKKKEQAEDDEEEEESKGKAVAAVCLLQHCAPVGRVFLTLSHFVISAGDRPPLNSAICFICR